MPGCLATGPTALRTHTFPDLDATLLYSGGPLGTPSSGNLSNCTAYPTSSLTGLGTGVATALATALNTAGGLAPVSNAVLVGPTLGVASATSLNIGSGKRVLASTGAANLGGSTDGTFIDTTYTPQEPASKTFRSVYDEFTNPGGNTRKNVVWAQGYNVAAGGRFDSNDHAFGVWLENAYGLTGTEQVEWYLQGIAADGTTVRPFSSIFNRATAASTLFLVGDTQLEGTLNGPVGSDFDLRAGTNRSVILRPDGTGQILCRGFLALGALSGTTPSATVYGMAYSYNGPFMHADAGINWSDNNSITDGASAGTVVSRLSQESSGVLAITNGTAATYRDLKLRTLTLTNIASNINLTGGGAGSARNINFGTGYGSAALTLYDGGAGSRHGWGLQASEMQFFIPTGDGTEHFSWNKGGDLQAAGTNQLMKLTSAGALTIPGTLAVTGSASCAALTATSGTFTGQQVVTLTTAQRLTRYDASNLLTETVSSSGGYTQSLTGTNAGFTWTPSGSGGATLTTGALTLTTGNLTVGGTTTTLRAVAYVWPSAQGGSNTYLKNDGSGNLSWASSATGPAGGSDTQIQYNNSGAFGGSANLTWDNSNQRLAATIMRSSLYQLLIGNAYRTVGRCTLAVHYADGSSTHTDGTEDDLYTDTLLQNVLYINGDIVEAEYAIDIVGSATATRRVRAYFGGTVVLDSGTQTFASGGACFVYVTVTKETDTVVRVRAEFVASGITLQPTVTNTRITGLTLSNTQIIKITGVAASTGAASGDIVAKSGLVVAESGYIP